MRQREVLIDGDLLPYIFGYRNEAAFDFGDTGMGEHIDEEKALQEVDDYIGTLKDFLDGTRVLVCLSDVEDNWRWDLLESYKANRDHSLRPALWETLRDHIRSNYEYKQIPRLEADDVLAMLMTARQAKKRNRIIVSVDKDMLTIPGYVYNPNEEEFYEIDQLEADRNHMHQTLTGDQVDNYKGCRGIGKKRADRLLDECESLEEMWHAVHGAFIRKGYTKDDALVQARVAYLLRNHNYDFDTGEVQLWTPPDEQ